MPGELVEIRFARATEAALVSSVLVEAATWIAQRGEPLWPMAALGAEAVAADVAAGWFVLVIVDEEVVATARLTRDDPKFWPGAAPGVAAYVHRVAVRRAWAGRGLVGLLLDWCEERAKEWECSYLRLDCDVGRLKLRALYEGLGFRFHSEHDVEHFRVARFERAVR